MASYELWQTRTRNLIGAFATEAEALALVRKAAKSHCAVYIDSLFLGFEDAKGAPEPWRRARSCWNSRTAIASWDMDRHEREFYDRQVDEA